MVTKIKIKENIVLILLILCCLLVVTVLSAEIFSKYVACPTDLMKDDEDKHHLFDFKYFKLKDSINRNLSFEETVKQIEKYCSNDTQKLSLVAGWIYDNIDFDLRKFYSGGIANDYKTVFSLKKGICGDYSNIFAAFCNKLNIVTEIIEGYVPEFDSDNKIYYETNHVWNVVKIGNNWYHCDLLGFSGYLEKKLNGEIRFVKKPNINNFMTQNISFLSEHIPADPIWQLLNYPIPLDTLIKYRSDSKVDSTGLFVDYENEINRYINLSYPQKKLLYADNANKFNKNNSDVIVIEYYNASVDLINSWNRDKQKLILARKYLEKAKKHIRDATDTVKILDDEIERALALIRKYVP